jgi:hypothetical protein
MRQFGRARQLAPDGTVGRRLRASFNRAYRVRTFFINRSIAIPAPPFASIRSRKSVAALAAGALTSKWVVDIRVGGQWEPII